MNRKKAHMTARHNLLNLYQTWRELTEREGEAIRVAAWAQVSRVQEDKAKLQAQIIDATERFQTEMLELHGYQGAEDSGLRSLLAELIQLEQRNGEWLATQRCQAEKERQELASTSRNLRQVHRAYATSSVSGWESYS